MLESLLLVTHGRLLSSQADGMAIFRVVELAASNMLSRGSAAGCAAIRKMQYKISIHIISTDDPDEALVGERLHPVRNRSLMTTCPKTKFPVRLSWV